MKEKKPRPLSMDPLQLNIALRGAMAVPAPEKASKADAAPKRAPRRPSTTKPAPRGKRKRA